MFYGQKERSEDRSGSEFHIPFPAGKRLLHYPDEENPINQALRYAGKILAGKYEMPEGLEEVIVDKSVTPVYIYIVCDIVPKIKEFATLP